MKRRDDQQLTKKVKDQFESLENEEGESPGTFKRATAEVLKERKIVKAKRPASSSDTTSVSANPFSGFGGLAAPTSAANPFSSFSGLTSTSFEKSSFGSVNAFGGSSVPTTTTIKNSNVLSSSQNDTINTNNKNFSKTENLDISNSNVASIDQSSLTKMGKLNRSFMGWIDKQIVNHPLSDWKEGLKDYVIYSEKILASKAPEIAKDRDSSSWEECRPVNEHSSKGLGFTVPSLTASSQIKASEKNSSTFPSTSTSSSSFNGLATASTKIETAPKVDNAPIKFGSLPTTSSSTTTPGAFLSFPSSFGTNPLPGPITTTTSGTSSTLGAFGSFPSVTSGGFGSFGGSSLNFGIPKVAPVTSTQSGDGGEEGGGDDEGEDIPLMEPEKVLKDANDTSEVMFEVKCKFFRFNKSDKEWKDSGKGLLRITKERDSPKQLLLIRNEMGKILLNCNFYKGMKFEKMGKNGIRFLAVADESGELKMLMVRVSQEQVQLAMDKLNAGVSSWA